MKTNERVENRIREEWDLYDNGRFGHLEGAIMFFQELVDKECDERVREERERILTFIRSGHSEPWKDTGWSIELSDVEDFILTPTKTDKQNYKE